MTSHTSNRVTHVGAVMASTALAGAVLLGASPASAGNGLGYDPLTSKGALGHIAQVVGAHESYLAGITGAGVGVALIDTGVTRVPGLDTGNVIDGPDLSFDSQDPELAHLDAYGHGTHLASIIAGRDQAGAPASYADPTRFSGIAPDSTLISVKVGASDGAVDVTQVIAAIDWVVEHRNDPGLNIRVINLSYGTDSLQDSSVDPLAYAAENAWRHGIVVVAAGGNDGSASQVLANPASDPYVLAVGASDTVGTVDPVDDFVPVWASRGDKKRHVDVVAPGVSVLGLRVPGGYADERNPGARTGDRFARASGTSQAAAVVSGEVALLLQADPSLTPDQVKNVLMTTATPLSRSPEVFRGMGVTDVRDAQLVPAPRIDKDKNRWGTGTGSIEAARGSSHVNDGVNALAGERDIFGNPWDGRSWAAATTAQTVWDGGAWRGYTMTGDALEGTSWGGAVWTQASWTARTWRDGEWTARTWRDGAWAGVSWSASTWRDATWSASTWRAGDLASVGWN